MDSGVILALGVVMQVTGSGLVLLPMMRIKDLMHQISQISHKSNYISGYQVMVFLMIYLLQDSRV